MASLNNLEPRPEKVVIVAGPSFGNAIQFVLFGAALGAAATYALLGKKLPGAPAGDAVIEGLTASGTKESGQQIVDRLNKLQTRLRSLAARTKDTVQTASEVLGPAISQAFAEGKKAAHEIEIDLAQELKNPPMPPKPDSESANIASEQA
ncbi:MAG: hypothetical protein JWN98_718 [Abditibacteriota bacterium]|nr:hypothetical protein [Abditibacteriota bacterium]